MKYNFQDIKTTQQYYSAVRNPLHISNLKKRKWAWGGEIIFSHGSSASRGVAILLPGDMEYEILEKYKDSDGRLIIIKCKFKNTNYIISNCYGQHSNTKIIN